MPGQGQFEDMAPHALGAATVVLAVWFSVPQFLRLRAHGSAAGVSLPALTNSAISFLAWTAYALSIGDGWLIASSAAGVPGAAAAVWAARRSGASMTGLWLPVLWTGTLAGALAVQLLSGDDVMSVVVGGSVGWLVVPAVVTAWRSADVSDVSAPTWWALVAEGLLFLAYGVVQGIGAPVVYGVIALTGSGLILLRLSLGVTRRHDLVLDLTGPPVGPAAGRHRRGPREQSVDVGEPTLLSRSGEWTSPVRRLPQPRHLKLEVLVRK